MDLSALADCQRNVGRDILFRETIKDINLFHNCCLNPEPAGAVGIIIASGYKGSNTFLITKIFFIIFYISVPGVLFPCFQRIESAYQRKTPGTLPAFPYFW